MSLFHLDLKDISIKNIENLIQDEVVESKSLEYKREFNFEPKGKVEFLNDVTAMANATGGDILFGVEDCEGKPKLKGLEIKNVDSLTLQIENIIRDSVTPRLKYEIKSIKTTGNTFLVLIRIFESKIGPHMVSSGGFGFYKRNQSGKHKMSVDELRESFMESSGYSKELIYYISKMNWNTIMKLWLVCLTIFRIIPH